MPPANNLPKYALFDFHDGSVETGASGLIDVECDETSDRNFAYDVSHFVYWPHRPSKKAEEEEVVKLRQSAKILLFGNDLMQLKHYRDQLTDEILPVESFGKIREKIWEKTDKPEAKINGQIQIALGSGERQSKRLREKKDSGEESRKTITPKTTKTSVGRKPGVKKKYDVQKSEDTLKKIMEQKALFDNVDEKPSDHTFQEPVKKKRTRECSGESTASTTQLETDGVRSAALSVNFDEKPSDHTFQEPSVKKRRTSEISEESTAITQLETDDVRSAGRAGSEVNKFIASPRTPKLSSSSAFSPATSDEEISDVPEKKSISKAALSTSASLEALKAEMNQKSSDDIQSLKDKVRYLQAENDKLKCKLKFYEEFTNVRTWIDQLIAKQQLSSPSDVIASVSKIDEPPADKLESKIDLENPSVIEARFPITDKVIDSIPPKNKQSDKKFVAALLRLMYPEEYLATHTMGANLTGKPSMDEKELTQIIDQTLIYFNYINLPKNEKDEKIAIIRKAITATLNNIKQKNKKK